MRGVLWRLLTSLGCCKRKNPAKGAIELHVFCWVLFAVKNVVAFSSKVKQQ